MYSQKVLKNIEAISELPLHITHYLNKH